MVLQGSLSASRRAYLSAYRAAHRAEDAAYRAAHRYDTCPQCGGRKYIAARTCKACFMGTRASRFAARVDSSAGPDACWPWTGKRNPHRGGYGMFEDSAGAHRVAFEFANGPIPDGLCVLHRCDNPPCCNPAHLWLGTKADNVRDMVAKGRSASGPRNGQYIHGRQVGVSARNRLRAQARAANRAAAQSSR